MPFSEAPVFRNRIQGLSVLAHPLPYDTSLPIITTPHATPYHHHITRHPLSPLLTTTLHTTCHTLQHKLHITCYHLRHRIHITIPTHPHTYTYTYPHHIPPHALQQKKLTVLLCLFLAVGIIGNCAVSWFPYCSFYLPLYVLSGQTFEFVLTTGIA